MTTQRRKYESHEHFCVSLVPQCHKAMTSWCRVRPEKIRLSKIVIHDHELLNMMEEITKYNVSSG